MTDTALPTPTTTNTAARRAVVPLHRYLSAMIWWALVPVVLLAGALAAYHVVDVGRDIDAEGGRAAAALATSVERGLRSRVRGLSMLAHSNLLDEPMRLAEFHVLAQSYQRAFGSHVVLADTEQRMLLNTRLPWGAPLPPLPRPRGRAAVPVALQTGQAAVGDTFLGPVSNTQLVALALPVQRDSRTQTVLLTVFEVGWFQPLIDDVPLATGWSMTLLDSSGQVIASRGLPPQQAVGSPDMGGHRYAAELKMAPWRVVVGVPDAIHNRPMLRMGATMLLALVLATLAGLLGGRLAARRLARAIDALSRTEASASVPPSVPPEDRQREIAEVAVTRARLREATTRRELAERQREAAATDARRAHAVLQQTMARIDDGVAAFDRAGCFTYANDRAAQMLGCAHAGDLVGRQLAQVLPEAEGAEWHAACAAALASDGPLVREVFVASSQRWIENRLYLADDGVSIHLSDVTERRHADTALRESRARLDAAMEAMGDAVFICDAAGGALQFNSAFVSFNRFASRAACPAQLSDYAGILELFDEHGQPLPLEARPLVRALRGEVANECILGVRRKDSGERWMASFNLAPIHDAAGRIAGAVVTGRDITQRFQAEAALRRSEQRFRALAEQMPAIVYRAPVDAIPAAHYVSPAVAALGYTPAQWTSAAGPNWLQTLHPEDRPRVLEELRIARAQERAFRLEYRLRDHLGRWRHFIEYGCFSSAEGDGPEAQGVMVEITEIKLTEQALREAEAYQRSLFEALADGVLLLDAGLRVLDANPAAAAMLGCTRHELVGMALPQLLAEDTQERVHHEIETLLQAHEPRLAEWDLRRRSGAVFPAEVSARAVDGQRHVAVLRDITERREARRALEDYQRELSELTQRLLHQERETSRHIAQALHDHLGQSLAVARLRLDAVTVGHGATMPAPLKQEFTHIGEAINQAIADVRLVLSDLRPQVLEEQGLTAALDNEIRERSITAGHVNVVLDVDGPTLAVRWPADVEYAALMIAREAIVNAQQHAQALQVRVRVEGDGHWLRLAVQDDGIGIAEALAQGRPGHLGLVGMRERALAIAAGLQVEALPEGGSRVQLLWKEENE